MKRNCTQHRFQIFSYSNIFISFLWFATIVSNNAEAGPYPSVRVAVFDCSVLPNNRCSNTVRVDIRSQSFDAPMAECLVTTSHPFPYYITSVWVPSGQMGWTDFNGYEYSCFNQPEGKEITFTITCLSAWDIIQERCECTC